VFSIVCKVVAIVPVCMLVAGQCIVVGREFQRNGAAEGKER